MHIPTPHLHKRAEKRKASLDSVAHSDAALSDDGDVPAPVVEKKSRKSKKKAKKAKAKKETLEATSVTPDDAHIRPATPLSASPVSVAVADPTTPPHTTAADQAVHESYVPPSPPSLRSLAVDLTPRVAPSPRPQTPKRRPRDAAPASETR
jgi:hypothetical protein